MIGEGWLVTVPGRFTRAPIRISAAIARAPMPSRWFGETGRVPPVVTANMRVDDFLEHGGAQIERSKHELPLEHRPLQRALQVRLSLKPCDRTFLRNGRFA